MADWRTPACVAAWCATHHTKPPSRALLQS